LVHWLLMGGLLHLVQRGGAWVGCGPAQSPPRCTYLWGPWTLSTLVNRLWRHCLCMAVAGVQ